jgi:hypothetical protein
MRIATVLLVALLGTIGCDTAREPAPPRSGDGGVAGTSAPLEDFLAGTRLQYSYWLTEDGHRQRVDDAFDRVLGVTCVFSEAADGKQRCLPSSHLVAHSYATYADARCSQPVGQTGVAAPEPRYVAVHDELWQCGGPATYYAAGAAYDGSMGYSLRDGACVPARLSDPRLTYFHAGEPVPADRFLVAEEVVVPRGGRLAERHRRAEDGSSERIGLYDTREKVACRPEPGHDGVVRCLPARRYALDGKGESGNASCQGPRLATQTRCPNGTADLIEAASTARCPRAGRLYQPGPAWSGGPTFVDDGAGCRPSARPDGPRVEIGTEVAPDRFVRLALERAGPARLRTSRYSDGEGATVSAASWAYDSVLDVECEWRRASDGMDHCIPILANLFFLDGACSEPVLTYRSREGECPPPLQIKYALWRGRYYERGAKLPAVPAQVFRQDPDGCHPVTLAGTSLELQRLGAEVTVGFVAGTLVTTH